MTSPNVTETVIAQGRALVRAIELTGPSGRALAHLLMAAYKHRLRAIAEAAPAWVSR